jgi:Asp-tRNA(Asn)/Glu-tRNA(Gln) amidotransferase A subunit family amidase
MQTLPNRAGGSIDDLARLTLSEAASGIRRGLFSAEQLTARYLERIRQHDSRIHAWAFLDASRALDEARKADDAVRAGPPLGALHGIPIGIKDIIYTKGMPTRMGSPIFADFVPEYSAACVERLHAAGAFVQGKTVTTEFANQHPGRTTNPWNPEFTPGGSSSGSAAAVAADFTAAALGSQTRGSTIRPAVYCGVVGYKPSFGLISRFGMYTQSATLDHVGVLTRSVDDAGLLVACLASHDARDPGSLTDAAAHADLAELGDLREPPRIAAVRSPLWSTADEAQQLLFKANCRALRERGAKIEEVDLPAAFNGANDATRLIQLAEMAHNYRELMAASAAQMSAALRALCERGLGHSAVEYLAARDLRERLRKALGELFEGFDAIVTPPATGEAPRALKSTGDAGFCAIWTLCGVPSVAFPAGTGPSGLPMGLQVVGAYLEDRRALQVAKWCMRCLPFTARLGY